MATTGSSTSTGPDTSSATPGSESRDGASLGDLVKEASVHLSTLVRSELELAKAELAGEAKKAIRGAIFFISALAVFLLALPFLFVTLAEVLIEIGLVRWLGYLVVTLLFFLAAGLLAFLGYRKVRRLRAPQRTIETVKGHAALAHRGNPESGAPGAPGVHAAPGAPGAPGAHTAPATPPALPSRD